MGDSQINIIIQTLKRGTGDKDTQNALKNIGKQFQAATGFSLSYVGGISAAVAISKRLVDITKESVNALVAEANLTEKMVSLTGSRAEEISRLRQVADDMKLSEESLEKALEGATKKGIDVSVESLAKLSDEYLRLAPGLERAKFLTDTFGKSGSEMYKIMKLGGQAIRDKSAAISASLVIDQKAIDMANAYQLSVDDVADAVTGWKNILAREALPTLTQINNALAYNIELLNESDPKGGWLLDSVGSFLGGGTGVALLNFLDEYNAKIYETKLANGDFSVSTYDAQAAAELLGKTYVSTSSALDDYSKTYQTSTSYIEKFMDLQGKSASEVELATHRIILSMLEKKLAEDGLTQAEMDSLLKLGEQWGIYSETAIQSLKDAQSTVEDLARSINGLPTLKELVINVKTTAHTSYISNKPALAEARASGGPVRAGESYWVGENGPEPFIPDQDGYIVSNQDLGGYSSGNLSSGGVINGLIINVNGISDPEKAADAVMARIEQKLRLQAVGR
jgi:hypothetical protein